MLALINHTGWGNNPQTYRAIAVAEVRKTRVLHASLGLTKQHAWNAPTAKAYEDNYLISTL